MGVQPVVAAGLHSPSRPHQGPPDCQETTRGLSFTACHRLDVVVQGGAQAIQAGPGQTVQVQAVQHIGLHAGQVLGRAARCGNQGQVDYAMANEVLAKVAAREAKARPGAIVRALQWGPWEGGMVTKELKARFDSLGVYDRGTATFSLATAAGTTTVAFGQRGDLPTAGAEVYDAAGKVLDGPAPRPLDLLPIQVSAKGDVQIIDMEFKAGTKSQTRIV